MPIVDTQLISVGFPDWLYLLNNASRAITFGFELEFTFQVPKSGVIDGVRLHINSVSAAGTINATIRALDTDGLGGSLYGGSAIGSLALSSESDEDVELTFGTSATATKGDLVSVKLTTTNATISISVADTDAVVQCFPGVVSGGQPTNEVPMLSLLYSDASYEVPQKCVPAAKYRTGHFRVGDNPNERGVKFVPQYGCRVAGVTFYTRIFGDSTNEIEVTLYDSSATPNVLASKIVPMPIVATIYRNVHILFDSSVELTAGDTYYICVYHDDATVIYWFGYEFESVNYKGSTFAPGVTEVARERTTDSDASAGPAFTETATNLPIMSVLLDGVSTSSGGSIIVIDD